MSVKKKIIIGNWKMNPSTIKEAEKLFTDVVKNISGIKKTEIVICPPFLYLNKLIKISKKIKLGAQNAFQGDTGPFTGEVSPVMLYDIGARYVIVGHSERRTLGENNIDINKKIKYSIETGLVPILCVGEDARDASHGYFNLIKIQLEECLNGVSKNLISKIIIAYEPVWALSSTPDRKDATPEDSREMAIFIRKILADKFGIKTEMPKIIYGGSVSGRDAKDFLESGGMDGLLVGRNSLDVKKFLEIIKIAESFRE